MKIHKKLEDIMSIKYILKKENTNTI